MWILSHWPRDFHGCLCANTDCFGGGLHVVDTDDVGALEDGGGDGGHGAVQSFLGGAGVPDSSARMRPMKDLREVPISSGIVGEGGDQLIELRDQFEVLFLTLAETNAGIDHDRLTLHATSLRHVACSRAGCVVTSSMMSATGGRRCIVAGVPRECIKHESAPRARSRIGNVEIKTQC